MINDVMRLVNVTKVYVIGIAKFKALRDVNLTIPRGAFIAIMGPSGSGKTTLLNIMGLLDRPTSGKVYINGLDTSKLSDKEVARIRNEKIGFVFQQYNLIGRLTVLENIELPLIVRGIHRSKRIELVKKALIEAGGEVSWLNKRPSQLSGGQQQRVAIARAIVTSPSIVLADEPTGNLDTQTSGKVIKTFIDINKLGNTIVVVTHNPEVANCTQKIYVIRDGAIVGVREPERDKCIA
ncbi:MAG: ABC transporter ATP-binding protein [Sulfolobales archaeon]|nr:ABC transporter ATP-binding protein [Sulfolobales archaeon]MCX8199333.1 ABC transporter ATP-binding protein [Sulfolobales archaeon]